MRRGKLVPELGLTVTHRYQFDPGLRFAGGALATPAAWDQLRVADPSFGFGPSREAWIARAQSFPFLERQGRQIVQLLRQWGVRRMVSVGVGTAMLEYQIQRLYPELLLRCGDFAPASLEMLRQRFTECRSIEAMDLKRVDWVSDPEQEVVLLNRVDTELTDGEWRDVFGALRQRRVWRIIFIPCGLLTPLALVREVQTILRAAAARRPLTRAGYLRTEGRLRQLFGSGHDRTAVYHTGELPIWVLILRSS